MDVEDSERALLQMARGVVAISLRAADRTGGVSMVQLRALTLLDGCGPANLGQLSEWMGVTDSTGSRLVDRLVAAGLVDRRRAEHSRREVRLELTDRGREVLAAYDRHRLEEIQERLATLPERHRRSLHRCLPALSDAASRLGDVVAGAGVDGQPYPAPRLPVPVED